METIVFYFKQFLRNHPELDLKYDLEEIVNDYGFGLAIAKACVDKGYEEGHYAGYNEVRTQSQIAADFAEEILRIIGPA